MSDKVQMKIEGNETSLFHHGLIKLLVLEELNILDIDWTNINTFHAYLSKQEMETCTRYKER